MRKKVSVIMGVYNSEKTLTRAIDSIMAQTFQDWIFIICDDGSTDNSLSLLKKYELDYPDSFLIISNTRNRGLTYSLNHCLKYADSDYIARMDSDDISLPTRFEKEVAFLDSHPEYSFVGCSIERFDENGVWMSSNNGSRSPSKTTFYMSSGFVHPTMMVRKSAYDLVSNYKDVWYTKRCEDYDLWMRMYAKGLKGYIIGDVLFQYYEGKNSFPSRKYRYRINEAITRAIGYSKLNLYPLGALFVLKPLMAGLLPPKAIKLIHKVFTN